MHAEILTAINRLIDEKTFSLEAVEAIKKMRDELSRVTELAEKNAKDFEHAAKLATTYLRDLTEAKNRLEGIEKRENDVALREKEATKLELKAEYQTSRGNEMKELISLVFSHPVLRRTAWKDIPVPGGYGTQRTTETEETTEN